MNLLYTFHTINFNTGGLLIDVVSYMRGGGGAERRASWNNGLNRAYEKRER